ncbi:uncharacterized protein C8Q71DRAFT_705679 [Rhodofomes roseus]|uniref:SHSP domain-containing protein n=1 Tax=Rhodofomes roseus TaxID=34475 RepID=A0ABQ8KLL1_9APHY|nr:uncharacterized protein C8Q71DRAFT_705679 [Rhodofomes roseus]KAH9838600.1 hypothetical protein C8Q71DRAFT_705679 [Rhodofomes roseus]
MEGAKEAKQEPRSPSPPSPTVVSSLHTTPMIPDEETPDSLWEEVRRLKEKSLAKTPPKVRSIGEALSSGSAKARSREKKLTKRTSSPTFKESPDGLTMTVTFDIPDVQKQDMHVSFRSKHIIVTWRMRNVREKMEDGVLVRDRQEIKHTQFIPIPEGTKFEDVTASQDGSRLILTYPNSRCVPVSPRSPRVSLGTTLNPAR